MATPMAYARRPNTRDERGLPSVIAWPLRETNRRRTRLHRARRRRCLLFPRAPGIAIVRRLRLIAVLALADAAAARLISAALPPLLGAPVLELIPPDSPLLRFRGAFPAAVTLPVSGGTKPTLAALQQALPHPRPTTPPTAATRSLNLGRFSARLRQAQGRLVLPNGLASESSWILFSEALFCPNRLKA